MERSQREPFIQMLGRIAVHRPRREPILPAGATRVLLAILVAVGPEGTSLAQIANAYWPETRPGSWEVALRVSASHLNAMLPNGWAVQQDGDSLRLSPGDGFVDVWRLEAEFGSSPPPADRPAWVDPGPAFHGVTGVELVDKAAARVEEIRPRTGDPQFDELDPFQAELPLNQAQSLALTAWIRTTRRAVVTAAPQRTAAVVSTALRELDTTTSVVVGDRGLLLPLGPFAMSFPELRDEIEVEQGLVTPDHAERAYRVVVDALALSATERPQRLVIVNAHELDATSLKVASLLIDRAPLSDFAMIICGDNSDRDIRWLDFARRSVTAGCERIEADLPRDE